MESQPTGASASGKSPDKSNSFAVQAPKIELPKGGGAIRGIGEKFAANPVTGTASMSVPIVTSPGRSGFGPQLSLSYDSGAGNGPFGFGWSLSLANITRKTDNGLPQYLDASESDVFIISGAEDLVPKLRDDGSGVIDDLPPRAGPNGRQYRIRSYRPRIEGLFARIERWTEVAPANRKPEMFWRVISKDNVTTWYGLTSNSRVADPEDSSRVFSWLICYSHDDKGNAVVYDYVGEDSRGVAVDSLHERHRTPAARSAQRYLKRVRYGNRRPNRNPDNSLMTFTDVAVSPTAGVGEGAVGWLFSLVFEFEGDAHLAPRVEIAPERRQFVATASTQPGAPWVGRQDAFSNYRAGFEVRTCRRCIRALMFHHFAAELGREEYLVRSTDFEYAYGVERAPFAVASYLRSATQRSYRVWDWAGAQRGQYFTRAMPPLEFQYSQASLDQSVRDLEVGGLDQLPGGAFAGLRQWVDLDGEGASGLLAEHGPHWYYARNVSANKSTATLAMPSRQSDRPNVSLAEDAQLVDLAGDGQQDVVLFDSDVPGFAERNELGGWNPQCEFRHLPRIDWNDPNLRFIDLDGDGHADVLISEQGTFVWYRSLAEEGFERARVVAKKLDEDEGPRILFADATEAVLLADLSGDCQSIVRVRHNEVVYWPHLGYAKFGAKVTMENAPHFDFPEQFDPRRLHPADIDGSGTTDLVYSRADGVYLFRNLSGNAWADGEKLEQCPPMSSQTQLAVLDLMGNGTACAVWSSISPSHARPMRYIDLMGGQKPHLMIAARNNLGAETRIEYKASTWFYLEDERLGQPWITRLPFPVHVVHRVVTEDRVSRSRFVRRYAYHHGYFDGVEREFRGFGMVEQWDTDSLEGLRTAGSAANATNIDASNYVPPAHSRTWFHTGVYLGRERISNFFAGEPFGAALGEYYREPGLTPAQWRGMVLPDTILPHGLSFEEEREACRALRGSMLRQELLSDDGSARDGQPYTVIEQNFAVRCLQPMGDRRHGVFLTHSNESRTYHYEREPRDPRVQQALTLEVDRFGNTCKQASIGYGRLQADNELDQPDDQARQRTPLIIFTESGYTNGIDAGYADDHRAPLQCQTRSFDLTGYAPAGAGTRFFTHGDFVDVDANDPMRRVARFDRELAYHEVQTGGRERRLIEDLRTLFRADNLSGLLALGTLERRALPGEAYKLSLTQGLIGQVFSRPRPDGQVEALLPDPAGVLSGVGRARGGYVDLDANGNWWVPSGRALFSPGQTDDAATELDYARRHFFLPCRYRDPFYDPALRNETIVSYDAHDLLPVETRDALGNRMTIGARTQSGVGDPAVIGNDYRVLQPQDVMDPNRNRAAARFDVFGFVAGSAVSGKPEENLGDTLAGFEPDLDEATTLQQLANPLAAPRDVLLGATVRVVYDVDAHRRARAAGGPAVPSVAMTLARETHASDPGGAATRVRVNLSYSDGFGREIQKKAHAEPGEVVPGGPIVSPRWVGSGWIIYNNKGKPVRQFEPFFSATPAFEFDSQVGESAILFYDPLDRVVATLSPDHSYQKTVFSPWRHRTYDANDTSAARGRETGDPGTDPDVGAFMAPYFRALNDPAWQTWRVRREALGAVERRAAEKAAAHADTPSTTFLDTLGRVFLTVVSNRVVCPRHDLDGTSAKFASRTELDIEGNQRSIRDAVEQAGDPLGRICARYDYDLAGNRIGQISMEAGARWTLNDVAGQPLRSWDSRGHQSMAVYDVLRRPLEQLVRGTWPESDPDTLGADRLIRKIEYGESHPDAEALNLRTKALRHFDSAGVIENAAVNPVTQVMAAYDFKGNPLRKVRRLVADYRHAPDWLRNPNFESERFVSAMRYDAMNRPVQMIVPYGTSSRATIHVIQTVFNDAGLLDRVDVWLRRTAEPGAMLDPAAIAPAPVGVENIDYDARARRRRIVYKNGVSTEYAFDRETHFLARMRSGALQDLQYTYDAVGNVVRIADAAQQSIYFRNNRVDPSQEFTYDAAYRLIEATGREHLGQGLQPVAHSPFDGERSGIVSAPGAGRFGPNDRNAMGGYVERYVYDAVGNFIEMQHRGTDSANAGWTRGFQCADMSQIENIGAAAKTNNRLTQSTVNPGAPNPVVETYLHDSHGNMRRMPHLGAGQPGPNVDWNHRDQVQRVNLGGGGFAYYVYDASGQRVRKVWEKSAGLTEERLYLGGFEIFRKHAGAIGANSLRLERETLHVMDDERRIALVEMLTEDIAGSNRAPPRLYRTILGNHLGSSCVELDERGDVISYEEYSPYGSTTYQAVRADIDLPKRYRYTGKERDEETGLNYHGARYYAPWLGRWTAADPAGFVDGPNLYAYAKLNPVGNSDPTGYATKQQFQHVIATALEKAQAGNRTAVGTAAEAVLEGMLKKAGYSIIKGPVTNPGEHFADIVAYDPDSKQLLFFDNKHISSKKSVSRADAFVDVHDDAETAARKAGVIAEAQERFTDIANQLPAEQLDDIKKAFTKAAADPGNANFIVANATPRAVKNLVQKISQRLIDRGVKFADAAGGSKKLKADVDAKLAKGADATADALEAGSSAGKQLLKSLPAIGVGIAAGLAIPRLAQAAEEDLEYEEQVKELGAQPLFADLSVLRETAVIGGEEGGGELGGWGGAALGASVSWETGPGVILGTIGGAIIFGFAGDSVGGAAAGYLFDRAADNLYDQRMAPL